MIQKAYKYRIYPTEEQTTLLSKHFGCVRYIYNWALNQKIESYQKEKKHETYISLGNKLPKLKEEFPWLKEVNSQSLQQSLKRLDTAFTNFFRDKKSFPKFKSKKKRQDSFQSPQSGKIEWENKTISVPKVGPIKAYLDRKFEDGKIKTITISRRPSGKYFASVQIEKEGNHPVKPPIKEETSIGIDVGLKTYVTLSTGQKFDNPKYLRITQSKLKYNQYVLAKKDRINKKKGIIQSKRRENQRIKVATLHEYITNQRDDFLHKLTYQLTHDNQVDTLIIEDLSVKNMMKNHCLAGAIGDAAWGKFFTMLNYKCEWYGKNLLEIGRFEPSSKMCHKCGCINKELQLKDREWTCACGSINDRDINAALNIKSFGLHKQNLVGCGSSQSNAQGVWSDGTD